MKLDIYPIQANDRDYWINEIKKAQKENQKYFCKEAKREIKLCDTGKRSRSKCLELKPSIEKINKAYKCDISNEEFSKLFNSAIDRQNEKELREAGYGNSNRNASASNNRSESSSSNKAKYNNCVGEKIKHGKLVGYKNKCSFPVSIFHCFTKITFKNPDSWMASSVNMCSGEKMTTQATGNFNDCDNIEAGKICTVLNRNYLVESTRYFLRSCKPYELSAGHKKGCGKY